jgi:tryptophanyl-tRNA synthetase
MKSKKRILTGDRPTSRLHIGHYVGSLENRVMLQDEYEQFVIIADVQALTTHFEHPEVLRQNVLDLCIDYLSVGIDSEKSHIFVQSIGCTICKKRFAEVLNQCLVPSEKTEKS